MPTVNINKLRNKTVLTVETDDYVYVLNVVVPADGVVYVETGDKAIGNEILYRVWDIIQGSPLEFHGRGDVRQTSGVNHVTVSGDGWSYEAF